MGKRTHGPQLVGAIEANNHGKVHEILAVQVRNKTKIREICTSEIRRLPTDVVDCPLILAAAIPDPNIIRYMVAKHQVDVNFVRKTGVGKRTKTTTALITAVRRGLYFTVEALMALRADANFQNHKGKSALHYAVQKADCRIAKMLLAKGAQPNLLDHNQCSPLHIATKYGHVGLVKLLLQYGGDLYRRGEYGAIPTHIAAKQGHIPLLRLFRQKDFNINTRVPCFDGGRDKTPLHVAAEDGQVETVMVLIEQLGADVNSRDSEGETPLHCTVIEEYDQFCLKTKDDFTETAKVLIKAGAEVNIRNGRGETPLHHAARNEHQKTVDLLLRAGADPTLEDNDHNKPIDLVSEDDSLSRNCLKNAMISRERYMGGIQDMRARGISSSTQSFQNIRSTSNTSLDLEGVPRMSRSYSFQGISPLAPNNEILAGASLYDEGLYLQPLHARSNMVRSESGTTLTTLTGSVTLSRQSSQESLNSNTSSLYAHILDSSYEKRRNAAAAAKGEKSPKSPFKVLHRRRSREFKRGGPPPPDSDSSVCDDNWERRSLPPGRRSMSVDAGERVKFASLRKPSKQKGKDKKQKELIFVPSPNAKKLPSEPDSVSLHSEILPRPTAASTPYRTGSVPSSPMVLKSTRAQRSSSLVDESEIHNVKSHLRHVEARTPSSPGQNMTNVSMQDSDTSSLWQVTPNASITSVFPPSASKEPIKSQQTTNPQNQVVNHPMENGNADDGEYDPDSVYENIPADEVNAVYGNVPSPAPEKRPKPGKPQVAPSPRKPPTSKPKPPPPGERKKSEGSQPRSPEITIRVSPNQTISIRSNPSSPQDMKEKIENERLPENLRLKITGNESDSDDTFFDDASFDTISESSHGNRKKSPTTVKEHRESIADQLKKVVQDPKLKEWLAEQAERAKERQDVVGSNERVDFGRETESSTIKKNPTAKTKKTEGKATKPVPNPKPRNLAGKGKKSSAPPTAPAAPQAQVETPVEETDDTSFDDDSFDTLEDSEELREDVSKPDVHNESVQYETMNNLNDPGKPVPQPRKPSVPNRSREGSTGSQELLNWERVDPRDNESYYWEHTGTEEFMEARNQLDSIDVPPPPVHRLLPEAEYLQMHGVVKAQQMQRQKSDSQSSSSSRTLSTFKSPPNSPTIPRSAKLTFNNQTDSNQNVVPQSPSGNKGSIFVSIPGQGDLTDALRKPTGREVSDEYEFHKQQLELTAASPVTIESEVGKRLSQENLADLNHSPTSLGLPIINLEHSPNSKAVQRQNDPNQKLDRNQRQSHSSGSSTSVSHVPGPKNAEQMYAVVNKSVKRSSSNTSDVSSVSTSQKAPVPTSPQANGDLDRTASFSAGPVETSSLVNQISPDGARIPPYMLSREGIYEELPQGESPRRKVTIGTEQIIFPDDPERKPKDHDHRVIRYDSRGKPRISIVGGNADGVYIHRIDPGSDAEQKGLMEGDQILKINNQPINGMTKEEVTLMLLSLPHIVTLTVRYKRDRYDHIAANAGMGDSFYVKANFSYEPATQGEIRIQEGDVLSVRDTLPDGQVGSWRALKVNARPNEIQHGLIPNEGRAEQVALALKRAPGGGRGRSLEREPKAGFLRRSFKRSKSAERLNKETDAFQREQAKFEGVRKPAYERVEQRPPGFLRPVAVVGLFCDTVRDRLAQDCPGIFEKAPPEVEIPTSKEEGDTKDPVNLKIIHSITDKRKHCLMIVSPRAIQFLQQTTLHPIVIYLHPGSKMVIKSLRSQLAPRFDKRSAFMYEEAMQFEKTYAHLFTATVTYTTDDSWFTLLKDTINRIQNQPLWQVIPKPIPSASAEDVSPPPTPVYRVPESKPLPRGRAITRQIPSAIQNVMNRHSGGRSHHNGVDLDSSIASVESMDSSARFRKPMTLTYDGYFLSGPGNEDAESSSSSQSHTGGVNGQARAGEIPEPNGRPRGILKKRPSGGSVHSGAPSDYESDMSFSGDVMLPRRSPGMANGYPPRGDNIPVLQMEPKRVQAPMMRRQQGSLENGMAHHMVTSSPAMQRQPQVQRWGRQPRQQQLQQQQQQQQQQLRSQHQEAAPAASSRFQCKETDL